MWVAPCPGIELVLQRLRTAPKGYVTFEDATIYFSQEEWGILEEAQRLRYSNVMLENFALTALLELASFSSHIVAQLEMGAGPQVPDGVDMPSAMARGAYSGPGSDFCDGTDSPYEHRVSVERLSQNRNPKTALSTQKDMCGLHLKDILHLDEHQETHSRQKPHMREAHGRGLESSTNLHLQQMQQNVDTPIRRE
ncbi:zinc finger protein 792 [Talpa occidentalis]|uniref:zinc finger protein 792 n=1 Tax=Talpa occidentalis TaxID=50954 RepID=UPI0023F99146|nr:zinc finger protein 792 [Talpa occidentalis]